MQEFLAHLLMTSLFVPTGDVPQEAPPQPPAPTQQGEFTDEQILEAWRKLDSDSRYEVMERFRAEVMGQKTFQNTLLRFVLDRLDQDPGTFAVLDAPVPYDPVLHAPERPIKRYPLPPESARLKYVRNMFLENTPVRKLDSSWIYVYATREIRRIGPRDDLDKTFRNALNGFPPGLDLAEAVLEQWLDDGSQQATAQAFGHSYTGREGGVYAEFTLYDAWASGTKFETPDIDILGLIHDLENDWGSCKAPLHGACAEELPARVETFFVPYYRHRGLRNALARTFLSGQPALGDGYISYLDRFHFFWDDNESTPAKLLSKLPNPEEWESFLAKLLKEFDRSKEAREKGLVRRDTLHNNGREVRRAVIDAMVGEGHLRK